MYPTTIYCKEEDYESYIAAAAGHLLESDRSNEAKRLKSMDLSFEFGCSLNLSFIREKMELADVVCASEEVAAFTPTTLRIKLISQVLLMLQEPFPDGQGYV